MIKTVCKILKTNLLTILTITGVILGFVIGIILRQTNNEPFTPRQIAYVNFLGDIFLRMLKCLILPLVISSLISAIGSLDLSLSGKIGGRAVLYYVLTTIMAVILGIILVITIRPGVGNTEVDNNDVDDDNNDGVNGSHGKIRNVTTADTLLDLIRNMFPPNLIQACIQQYQTVLKPPKNYTTDLDKWIISGEFIDGMNILGLVVVALVTGIAMSAVKSEVPSLLKIFEEISFLMMKITNWVIWISPIGILFLICSKIIELENLSDLGGKLGLYLLTVSFGIIFHGFVVLPIIFFIFTRKNPYKFIGNMGEAMATAFGTASSSATLPVTIQCLESKNNVDPRVSRFVLPIGATINMDGTALYEAVAAIFIAQTKNFELSFGNIVAISITATAASIGAAGIPHAGLVTLVMVLSTVGLPAEDVSLVIAVDWLLDRIRTVVNVLGDSMGAGIVEHCSQNELKQISSKIPENNLPIITNHRTTINLNIDENNRVVQSNRL